LLDCSEFGNFVITLTYLFVEAHIMDDDDTALDGGADVGPVNLWMHSLYRIYFDFYTSDGVFTAGLFKSFDVTHSYGRT
jgi:hypothetical protein